MIKLKKQIHEYYDNVKQKLDINYTLKDKVCPQKLLDVTETFRTAALDDISLTKDFEVIIKPFRLYVKDLKLIHIKFPTVEEFLSYDCEYVKLYAPYEYILFHHWLSMLSNDDYYELTLEDLENLDIKHKRSLNFYSRLYSGQTFQKLKLDSIYELEVITFKNLKELHLINCNRSTNGPDDEYNLFEIPYLYNLEKLYLKDIRGITIRRSENENQLLDEYHSQNMKLKVLSIHDCILVGSLHFVQTKLKRFEYYKSSKFLTRKTTNSFLFKDTNDLESIVYQGVGDECPTMITLMGLFSKLKHVSITYANVHINDAKFEHPETFTLNKCLIN